VWGLAFFTHPATEPIVEKETLMAFFISVGDFSRMRRIAMVNRFESIIFSVFVKRSEKNSEAVIGFFTFEIELQSCLNISSSRSFGSGFLDTCGMYY